MELEIGKPLTFDVTLEVWPSFDINQYKGLQLKKKSGVVDDAELQKVLMDMAFRKAHLTVVQNGSVQKADQVICDCKVEVNGNIIFEDDDVEIVVVNGVAIVNTTVSDLATNLEGIKSGEERMIDLKLSQNFIKEEYRGREAKLKLTVKEIKRLVPPQVNEDLAKILGFDSLEDLKSNIRKRIEIDKKRWVEDDLRNQILDILLGLTNLELPQDFLNYHTEQRVYKHQLDLLNRGVPLEEIQKQTETIKNASAESVLRELKASLVMNHIAEKEKIFVTENEVEQRIADIARAYNTDTIRVRKQLERQGNLSYLRNDMRESKVMNFLLKEARIEE
ncbi:MAG: trigger factor [Planctomycetia bacterium]|nr:trigger factor [Planctomycetia bacterium]